MSNSLVFPFMRHVTLDETHKVLAKGIFEEMKKRFQESGERSWEIYKVIFDDMVTEAGVDVLFHSAVYKVEANNREIKKAFIATKSGTLVIEAEFFIDTTGDGYLTYMQSTS